MFYLKGFRVLSNVLWVVNPDLCYVMHSLTMLSCKSTVRPRTRSRAANRPAQTTRVVKLRTSLSVIPRPWYPFDGCKEHIMLYFLTILLFTILLISYIVLFWALYIVLSPLSKGTPFIFVITGILWHKNNQIKCFNVLSTKIKPYQQQLQIS